MRATVTVVLICVVLAGGLFFLLSQGPVSSDQLRSEVESQISRLLGDGHQATIGNANIAIGKGGLLSFDADDVKVLRGGSQNLGVAEKITVKLSALSLLRGKVRSESIVTRNASIALTPHLSLLQQPAPANWQSELKLEQLLTSLGSVAARMAQSVEKAGLNTVDLFDTTLVGFDALGLRSRSAVAKQISLKRNPSFQDGVFVSGLIETDYASWAIDGAWRKLDQGGHAFEMRASGIQLREFIFKPDQVEPKGIDLDSPVTFVMVAPFDEQGRPQQAQVRVSIDEGGFQLGRSFRTTLKSAVLNLRLLPQSNEIVLEQSPVQFQHSRAVLVGEMFFPAGRDDVSALIPKFKLAARNIVSSALVPEAEAAKADLELTGHVDFSRRTFAAETINLRTPDGSMSGEATFAFSGVSPALFASVAIPTMRVADFKQLWPPVLAPPVRRWAEAGILGGTIQNAWAKANLPAGTLTRREKFSKDQVQAHVPIVGASLRTTSKLPRLAATNALIEHRGMETDVSIKTAKLSLPENKSVVVTGGKFSIADFQTKPLPAKLNLDLEGSMNAMTRLTQRLPVSVGDNEVLQPGRASGDVVAKVSVDLELPRNQPVATRDWSADLTIKNGKSTDELFGRTIRNANLSVKASPANVDIDGTANIDGVDAKVALIQPLGKKAVGRNSITMRLSKKTQQRIGMDTAGIIDGPVDVNISAKDDGSSQITADLRNTRLSFPWVGWSKGKKVPATATFVLREKNGQRRFEKLVVKGKGFSVQGTIVADKKGLVSAEMKKVRLNKSDNFDVSVKRVKGGFDVAVNARSYDSRSIIKALFNNKQISPKGKLRVRVKGRAARLIGFNGQLLSDVRFDLTQVGNTVKNANVRAIASGSAPVRFSLSPAEGGMKTSMSTGNAGSVLAFLDIYSRVRGGEMSTNLIRDKKGISRGAIVASNFRLLEEPRLAALLRSPATNNQTRNDRDERQAVVKALEQVARRDAEVDDFLARIEKGPGYLIIEKGRLSGGDASAAFKGWVYDQNNNMNIRGTFLPGKALNKLVSRIPLIGLAFGSGKARGLLGITFQLRGPFGNPKIRVNPLSIIAPGVFRELFKF